MSKHKNTPNSGDDVTPPQGTEACIVDYPPAFPSHPYIHPFPLIPTIPQYPSVPKWPDMFPETVPFTPEVDLAGLARAMENSNAARERDEANKAEIAALIVKNRELEDDLYYMRNLREITETGVREPDILCGNITIRDQSIIVQDACCGACLHNRMTRSQWGALSDRDAVQKVLDYALAAESDPAVMLPHQYDDLFASGRYT